MSPRPLPEISDQDAITDVIRGNREMFEVLVRRYNQPLFRVGMAYLRDHAQVEDAMQNAYVKAFVHLGQFDRSAAFSTWITRIMINECLMMLRRRRARPEAPLEPEAIPSGSNEHPAANELAVGRNALREHSAAAHLNAKEMKALLEKAVAALPQKYRAVYMLREVQQLTVAETAAALGRSTASVKVDLHRARERLKSELLKSAAGAELFAYPACYCDPMTSRVMQLVLAIS